MAAELFIFNDVDQAGWKRRNSSSPNDTGMKAQTFKEIKENLQSETSEVVLRNNETVRS